ncbi:ABC-2 type transport system ATP-binding protein [Micromonospora pisi]|uniref:ABC-2 type transport system ATP-binding protein n=1 Tax=Micromonospora pisi TaxID=589240 RepID=A0A495JQF5_9ACTN|nr:ABC transporter ATP-binding protein [Micromonospora pisi]RKR90865.1 ABC-2 type transport system ATP-binding protein [Micromonospora pisi]
MLHVAYLTKIYRGGVRANDDLSLDVGEGEVLGLLGHNGAGKTTLLSQVAGLVRPTSGTLLLAGRDPVAHPAYARQVCSVQLQSQAPLTGVSPRQAIEVLGRIRGGARQHVRQRTAALLAALDIAEWADVPGERLSGGIRRLTAFCMAVVEPGRLVMLDEPTNDVDPVRRRLLWQQVRDLADNGCAVILVTHNVAEAERSVDRVVVLDHGRTLATGTPAELRDRATAELRLELTLTPGLPPPEPPDWAGAGTLTGRRFLLPIATDHTEPAVAWALRLRAAGTITQFALHPASLEDVYVGLTSASEEAGDAALVA